MALAGALVFGLACDGGGGSADDRQAIEDTLRQLVASGPEDVDFFLDHVTDDALTDFFGFTREDCRENAEECVGEPGTLDSISNVEISGDEASVDLVLSGDEGPEDLRILLVKEGDVWKFDGFALVPKEVPEGVKTVELSLNEFAFGFDAGEITDGNFAFVAKNVGEQRHQVIVVKIPEDLDLEAAIQSDEEPEGVEDVAIAGPFRPGDETAVVFEQPLEPGRYALICFLPDTEDPGTEHAQKGMFADFTVP